MILATLGIAAIAYYLRHPLTAKATIRGTTFRVELAMTPSEITKGLAYRKHLTPNHGMVFLLDHEEQYGFWMKGMEFPIDILWIQGATIVDIHKNVPVAPAEPYPMYVPRQAVGKVLELAAGTVDRLGIQIGDEVTFSD